MRVLVDEDASSRPLISAEQRSRTGSPIQDDHEVTDAEDNVTTAGWFLWLLTLAAGVSGLLFGYEYVRSFQTDKHLAHITHSQHWRHLLHTSIHPQ